MTTNCHDRGHGGMQHENNELCGSSKNNDGDNDKDSRKKNKDEA